MSLTDSTVSGNGASGPAVNGTVGGGIFTSGPMTLTRTTVTGNTSSYSAGGIYDSEHTLRLVDSTVSNNTAQGLLAVGGGIDVNATGSLYASHSTLSGNSAYTGGGVYSSGDATFVDSMITDNHAYQSGGVGGGGGGIAVQDGTTSITGGTIAGNTAAFGAGLFVYPNPVVTVNSVFITGNAAGNSGGGIWDAGRLIVTNSVLSGNSSRIGGGGGLYVDFAVQSGLSAAVRNSTITGNSAAFGGGIAVATSLIFGDTLSLSDTIVAGNTAIFAPDVDGSFDDTSSSYNLIGDPTGSSNLSTAHHNILNKPANLDPVTFAPLSNSGLL